MQISLASCRFLPLIAIQPVLQNLKPVLFPQDLSQISHLYKANDYLKYSKNGEISLRALQAHFKLTSS